MIKMASMWKNKSKTSDKTYYRGSLAPAIDLVMLKNEKKETPNQPDWILYIKLKNKDMMEAFTGLWTEKKFLQGRTKEGTLVQVRMQKKSEENHPDCAVFLTEKKESEVFE